MIHPKNYPYNQCGHLEVICGPMFSGKTEELIRRVKRAEIARQKVQIFRPHIDDRYDKTDVVTHTGASFKATPIVHPREIFQYIFDTTRVVGFDEVQFFSPVIIDFIKKLLRRGLRVICAGLDVDYLGQPFGPMPELLALADEVTKIQAICTVCGMPATKTQRLMNEHEIDTPSEQILVGGLKQYQARCREHHEIQLDDKDLLPLRFELDNCSM